MTLVLGLFLGVTALLCSRLAWIAGKRAGIAQQEAIYESSVTRAAELVAEAETSAGTVRDDAHAAARELLRQAELERAEIREQAELAAAKLSESTLQRLESECSAVRVDLDEQGRAVQLLQAKTEERFAVADRLERSHRTRLEELENRSPTRPLGGLSIQKLAERVPHNWHSPSRLSELAFELQRRTGARAGELLADISNRLVTLGGSVPRPLDALQADAHSAARLAELMHEVGALRKQAKGAHAAARFAARQEMDARREESAKWEARYRKAIDGESAPSSVWEAKYARAVVEAAELLREIATLRQKLESTTAATADRGALRAFFITHDATLEFVKHAHKFWQNRLHPDKNKGRDTNSQFQEMDRAFKAALRPSLPI